MLRSWVRWFRCETKLTPPRWRSGAATVGFASATVSLGVIISIGVHAIFTGGLPYFHPLLLLAFKVGFLASLTGILGAVIGRGQLEKPAIISSVLCLLIWIVEAAAQ